MILPCSKITGLWLILLLAGSTVTDAAPPETAALDITRPKQRLPAPDFSLPLLGGGEIHLDDFKGRIVLLNFWASFCAPCREEMPALQALWERYHAAGFEILAVAADRGRTGPVEQVIQTGGYRFPVLLDHDGTLRRRYEVGALPTSYLIGRDGRFLGRMIGPRPWASDAYRQFIQNLLEDAPETRHDDG